MASFRLLKNIGSVYGNKMTRKFARDERVYQKIATWNLVKGDKVEVIEGKDRGKQGTIIEVVRGKNAVVVGGIKVHPRMRRNAEGGAVWRREEALIHYSNVMLVDPVTQKPTKVHVKVNDEGRSVRVAKSGAIIGRPTEAKATKRPRTVNKQTDTLPDDVLKVTYVKPVYNTQAEVVENASAHA